MSADTPAPDISPAMHEALKALRCLYIAVDAPIADDINAKIKAAFLELESRLSAATRDTERLRSAAFDALAELQEVGSLSNGSFAKLAAAVDAARSEPEGKP